MALITKITPTNRVSKLNVRNGQMNNGFVRIQEFNELVDELNGVLDGDFTFSDLTLDTLVCNDYISVAAGGHIALDDGAVSDLPIRFGADGNNGFYGVSDTQLGVAVEGALVAGFNTTGFFTGNISEQVAAVGVTVDQLLIKDGFAWTVGTSVTQLTNLTTGVTNDSPTGEIVTVTATLAAGDKAQFTVTNSFSTTAKFLQATIVDYSGTLVTNGIPYITVDDVANGSFKITVMNIHSANALNGVIKIHFAFTGYINS